MTGEAGPRPISADFDLSPFDSGVADLDIWLKRRALANEGAGASRTFVIAKERRVVGYYALTVGSVTHGAAGGRVRRNMPDPIPVAILARLAIDRGWQGKGLGGELLQDAVLRVIGAAETLGIRALMIHALSNDAKRFYERYGFTASPIEPLVLIATLRDLTDAFFPQGLPSRG